MESSDNFEEHLLNEKKLKFEWIVQKYSQSLSIPIPKFKYFDTSCPYNDLKDWTHAHPQSNALCVSEKDLTSWDEDTMAAVVKKELDDLVKSKLKKEDPVGAFFSKIIPSKKKPEQQSSADGIYYSRKKHKLILIGVIIGIVALIFLSNLIKFGGGDTQVFTQQVPVTESYDVPENISYVDILSINERGYSQDTIVKGKLLKEEINQSEKLKTIYYYVVDDSSNKLLLNFNLVSNDDALKSMFPVNNVSEKLYVIDGTLKESLGELELYVKTINNYTRKTFKEERVIYVEQNVTDSESSEPKGWIDWLFVK